MQWQISHHGEKILIKSHSYSRAIARGELRDGVFVTKETFQEAMSHLHIEKNAAGFAFDLACRDTRYSKQLLANGSIAIMYDLEMLADAIPEVRNYMGVERQ